MIGLGLKEFQRRIFTNIFIALQLGAMFFIIIAIVSSVNARTELYLPIRDRLENDGVYLSVSGTGNLDAATPDDLMKKYPEIKEVLGITYCSFLSDQSVNNEVLGCPDELIGMYEPRLKDGRWLDSKDHDVIYAVADESSGLAVGDKFTLDTYYFAPEDVKFENAITITCNFEVIGIAGKNTKLFGLDKTFTEKDDFRNLYGTYEPKTDEDETFATETRRIYIPARQFERFTENKLNGAFTNTKYIVSFDDDISEEKADELYTQLAMYGSVIKLSEFSRLSKLYVYDKIVQLLPILICIALLMVVSTVSISTLNTKMSLRTYAIYYTLGCTWNRSIEISFVNAMLTSMSAACVCIITVAILKIQGFLETTVFEFGKTEFAFCLMAFAMYMLCSLLAPLVCINNTSPKENLRANE